MANLYSVYIGIAVMITADEDFLKNPGFVDNIEATEGKEPRSFEVPKYTGKVPSIAGRRGTSS